MTKEFESYDTAVNFLIKADYVCDEWSDFEIISIERESTLWFQDGDITFDADGGTKDTLNFDADSGIGTDIPIMED